MQPRELAQRFNYCKVGDDGILEFYCDHSLLSAFRTCESYGMLSYGPNPFTSSGVIRPRERNWNFDFGSWFHAGMEKFYWHEYNKLHRMLNPDFKTKSDKPEDYEHVQKGEFIAHCLMLWDSMEMEHFKNKSRNYEMLHGPIGAAKLVSDYWECYGEGRERIRVVGIELPFGRNKEVSIINAVESIRNYNSDFDKLKGEREVDEIPNEEYETLTLPWQAGPYRAYLTGRIDLMIDDGISISLVDHKSTAFFSGDEASKFNPHDGMLGYVYAGNQLMKHIDPTKRVNRMMINHAALQDNTSKVDKDGPKSGPLKKYDYDAARRFTRSMLTYTPTQLEEYRIRQAATFDILYQLLVLERPPQWNTSVCGNMYHKECPFKGMHSKTPEMRQDTLNTLYKIAEQWNPFYESKAEVV